MQLATVCCIVSTLTQLNLECFCQQKHFSFIIYRLEEEFAIVNTATPLWTPNVRNPESWIPHLYYPNYFWESSLQLLNLLTSCLMAVFIKANKCYKLSNVFFGFIFLSKCVATAIYEVCIVRISWKRVRKNLELIVSDIQRMIKLRVAKLYDMRQ